MSKSWNTCFGVVIINESKPTNIEISTNGVKMTKEDKSTSMSTWQIMGQIDKNNGGKSTSQVDRGESGESTKEVDLQKMVSNNGSLLCERMVLRW